MDAIFRIILFLTISALLSVSSWKYNKLLTSSNSIKRVYSSKLYFAEKDHLIDKSKSIKEKIPDGVIENPITQLIRNNPLTSSIQTLQSTFTENLFQSYDTLHAIGFKNPFGMNILMTTTLTKVMLLPFNYLIAHLSSEVQEIKYKIEIIKKQSDPLNDNQIEALNLLEIEAKKLASFTLLLSFVQSIILSIIYRSYHNLTSSKKADEPFLWLPSLLGPTYGANTLQWLYNPINTKNNDKEENKESNSFLNIIAYSSLPILVFLIQYFSEEALQVLNVNKSDSPQQFNIAGLIQPTVMIMNGFKQTAGYNVFLIANTLISTTIAFYLKIHFIQKPVKHSAYIQNLFSRFPILKEQTEEINE